MSNTAKTFRFGDNWRAFLQHSFDEQTLEAAKARTCELLQIQSLEGLTFLDIGCGSGLFSYVAFLLGASSITSVDVDPACAECCQHLRSVAGDPPNWRILQGSILDDCFIGTLPRADVVYSWGVLHHTGDMWRAIRNAASLVEPGGSYAIAIYNRVEYGTFRGWRGSHRWLKVKQLYNRSGRPTKRLMELMLAAKSVLAMLLQLRNPVAGLRAHKNNRGMNWWFDHVDWLGGLPYEFASAGEIFNFCHNECGMQLERMHTTSFLGLHEFLFRLPKDVSSKRRLPVS